MLLVIQPWFSAVGHPAQSLVNTAKIIGKKKKITYLISAISGLENVANAKRKLQQFGNVVDYPVKTDSVREGTLKALVVLRRLVAANLTIDRIFFLDAHLVLLAALWPFYYQRRIKTLSVVYLMGPERITRYGILKWLLTLFLRRREVVLFLRTEELAEDWQKAFPKARIRCLPSLEMPVDQAFDTKARMSSETIRLGVLGQIRTGKSLEWLVPLFKNNPSLGKLTIAGTFNNVAERQALSVLDGFEGFENKFLTEDELLSRAIEQDYLLMLYDNWDHRMEGAVMFLAARVNRPVIVYDKGWCARMVRTYGNGVLAPDDHGRFSEFVRALPVSGTDGYNKLLDGVSVFRRAHTGESIRNAFLDAIQA